MGGDPGLTRGSIVPIQEALYMDSASRASGAGGNRCYTSMGTNSKNVDLHRAHSASFSGRTSSTGTSLIADGDLSELSSVGCGVPNTLKPVSHEGCEGQTPEFQAQFGGPPAGSDDARISSLLNEAVRRLAQMEYSELFIDFREKKRPQGLDRAYKDSRAFRLLTKIQDELICGCRTKSIRTMGGEPQSKLPAYFAELRYWVFGTVSKTQSREVIEAYLEEISQPINLQMMLLSLPFLEAEAARDSQELLLEAALYARRTTATLFSDDPFVVDYIVGLAGDCASVTFIKSFLKASISSEHITRVLLEQEVPLRLLQENHSSSSFLISHTPVAYFKDLLRDRTTLVNEFLRAKPSRWFACIHELVESPSYLSSFTGMELLAEILYNRRHYSTMSEYISNTSNFLRLLELARKPSERISSAAFHVLKIFIAQSNPNIETQRLLNLHKLKLRKLLEANWESPHCSIGERELAVLERTLKHI